MPECSANVCRVQFLSRLVGWRCFELWGLRLTITETVLVFVVIPLAVVGLLYALVYGSSAARGKRYRPGRQFTSAPVWFLAEAKPAAYNPHHDTHHAPALVGSAAPALAGPAIDEVKHGEVGGASDSW
jgi:hypothetical protein